MGRQDYEGAPMDGVTGDVAGSTTSDVGSSQSLGQMASGQSFSGADLYGGGEAEQQIRQAVSDVRQQYMNRPEQTQGVDFGTYADLASRGGAYDFAGGGFGGGFGSAFNPLSFGVLGQLGKFIGQYSSRNLMKGLEKGYIPQYNAIGQIVGTLNPETGRYGAGTVRSRIDPNNPQNTILDTPTEQGDDNPPMMMGGGGGSTAPEVAPEVSMIAPELRYPAGGIYPEEGMYRRTSLLDEAPRVYGGLLAGYDQPQFMAMNEAFAQPTDVSLFQDPYDVTGYSLI
jgi:hypothetical protein